jgi:hypothetical protein
MRIPVLLAGLGTLVLGACATVPRAAPGAELIGRSLAVQTAGGQSSTLTFASGSVVTATFGQRSVQGRYFVADRRLCFEWRGAARECWPYAAPFPRGRTVPITSDRGNQVRVTAR